MDRLQWQMYPTNTLVWLWGENKVKYNANQCTGKILDVMDYINDNRDVLKIKD